MKKINSPRCKAEKKKNFIGLRAEQRVACVVDNEAKVMSANSSSFRRKLRSTSTVWSAAFATLLFSVSAHADLPTGEQVQSGSADFTRDTNSLTIDQHTGQLVVNWDEFSISAGNQVNFLQNASDIALNRVV